LQLTPTSIKFAPATGGFVYCSACVPVPPLAENAQQGREVGTEMLSALIHIGTKDPVLAKLN
jgi:hypothetical protein